MKQGDLLVALDPLQASATVQRHNDQLNQALALGEVADGLIDDPSIDIRGPVLDRLAEDPGAQKAGIEEKLNCETGNS